MATIGAFEAKTHFSQLLLRVSKGETIVITKHGESIAKLVPIQDPSSKENPALEAVKRIRGMRKGVKLGKNLTIKKLIKEGRKE